jgi:hypothetical protein
VSAPVLPLRLIGRRAAAEAGQDPAFLDAGSTALMETPSSLPRRRPVQVTVQLKVAQTSATAPPKQEGGLTPMSAIQARVVTPGGNVSSTVLIDRTTTAADVLRDIGLDSDFFLSDARGDRVFQPQDRLAPLVSDQAVLYANPWAQVG